MNCPICNKENLSKHEELTQKCMVCEQKEWIKNLTPKDTKEILSWAENIDFSVINFLDLEKDDEQCRDFIETNKKPITSGAEQAVKIYMTGNTKEI